ncbi:MAG: chromate transporter [Kiritimatiellia bacterium]
MIYWTLFWTFFKIGLFTLGGGYAMIPLIQREVIEHYAWMTRDQFIEFVGIAESTPGPFAINISTFAGMHTAGILGSLCSTGGVVLPSLIIILLIAGLFHSLLRSWIVQTALQGAAPVIVGLIGAAAITLLARVLWVPQEGLRVTSLLFAAGLFSLMRLRRLNPILIILLGAGLGMLLFGLFGLQP